MQDFSKSQQCFEKLAEECFDEQTCPTILIKAAHALTENQKVLNSYTSSHHFTQKQKTVSPVRPTTSQPRRKRQQRSIIEGLEQNSVKTLSRKVRSTDKENKALPPKPTTYSSRSTYKDVGVSKNSKK